MFILPVEIISVLETVASFRRNFFERKGIRVPLEFWRYENSEAITDVYDLADELIDFASAKLVALGWLGYINKFWLAPALFFGGLVAYLFGREPK